MHRAYVGNNAINLYDPDGQAVPLIIVAGVAAYLAGTGNANAPGPGDPQFNTPPPIAKARMAGLGLCAGGGAAKAGLKKGGQALKKQANKIKFQGPDPGNGGRIFGMRLKSEPNLFRLDYAPFPYSGGGPKVSSKPRLHCHLGRNEGPHYSLDPRDLWPTIRGMFP